MKTILAATLASLVLAPAALARPKLEVQYVAVKGATQDIDVGSADVVALEIAIRPKMDVRIAETSLASCDRIATKLEGGKYYAFYAFEAELDSGFNGCVAEVTVDGKVVHTVSFGVNIDD